MQNNEPWKTLAVLCGLTSAAIGISINTSGVFYSAVAKNLGILQGSYAFHMTIFTIMAALSGLLVPSMIKTFPFKKLLVSSVLVAVLGTGLMGQSSQLLQFYFLGGLRGFSTGVFSMVTVTLIINEYFTERNGLATSIALGFSGLMGALFSPIFAILIAQLGWKLAYFFEAILILCLCLPSLVYPFHFQVTDDTKHLSRKIISNFNIKDIIRALPLILFSIFIGFASSMIQHLPNFARSISMSDSIGASLLSMGMIGNITSKLLIGFLSDKIGALKSSLIILAVTVGGPGILLMSQNPFLLSLAAFLFGFTYGLGSVSIALLTREIFSAPDYITIFPYISFSGTMGAAGAFSIIGFIYDFTRSYRFAFFILIVLLLFSGICLLVYCNQERIKNS